MLRFDPFQSKDLSQLSVADFRRLVEDGVVEGLWVEYKSQWTPQKVARAVASFANSDGGGTVVIGVVADGLTPKDAPGFDFDGEVEAAVVNTVRANVAPIPSIEVGAAISSDRRRWAAVRVPPGTDPPYVMANGEILIRTPTSSEPVRLTDRDAMDRLYLRGRRGEEWASAQRKERLQATHAMGSFPPWIKFWTIPCVAGGLDVSGRILREPFIDEVANMDFTGWGRPARAPDVQTLPTSLLVRQILWNDVALSVGCDGTLQTTLLRGKGSGGGVREPLTFEEVRQTLGPTCRIHRVILERLLTYSGKVMFGLSGALSMMNKFYIVEHAPNSFPTHFLTSEEHIGRTERTIRRFFVPAIPDP